MTITMGNEAWKQEASLKQLRDTKRGQCASFLFDFLRSNTCLILNFRRSLSCTGRRNISLRLRQNRLIAQSAVTDANLKRVGGVRNRDTDGGLLSLSCWMWRILANIQTEESLSCTVQYVWLHTDVKGFGDFFFSKAIIRLLQHSWLKFKSLFTQICRFLNEDDQEGIQF